jgi:hypothetical protein
VADKPKVISFGQSTANLFDAVDEVPDLQKIERRLSVPVLRIGTLAFTAAGHLSVGKEYVGVQLMTTWRLLFTVITLSFAGLFSASASAATVSIRVMDPGSDGLSKVLVITKSLEGDGKEISRVLSGPDGFVPPIELALGLYETITTYPNGNIRTQVKDFVVTREPLTIEIHLDFDLDQKVNSDVIDWQVRVFDQKGMPAVNAWVIGRNMEASTGTSAVRTDGRGFATVL